MKIASDSDSLEDKINKSIAYLETLEFRVDKLNAQIEQLRVQLAGCLTAAEGFAGDNPPKEGDYGWTLAFQKTLELRKDRDWLAKEYNLAQRIESYETDSDRTGSN
jgi:hypothetical protein